jgi:hypothetical protein
MVGTVATEVRQTMSRPSRRQRGRPVQCEHVPDGEPWAVAVSVTTLEPSSWSQGVRASAVVPAVPALTVNVADTSCRPRGRHGATGHCCRLRPPQSRYRRRCSSPFPASTRPMWKNRRCSQLRIADRRLELVQPAPTGHGDEVLAPIVERPRPGQGRSGRYRAAVAALTVGAGAVAAGLAQPIDQPGWKWGDSIDIAARRCRGEALLPAVPCIVLRSDTDDCVRPGQRQAAHRQRLVAENVMLCPVAKPWSGWRTLTVLDPAVVVNGLRSTPDE